MTNRYFNNTTTLTPLTRAKSADVESKFTAVEQAFDQVETELGLVQVLDAPELHS